LFIGLSRPKIKRRYTFWFTSNKYWTNE